MKNPNNVSQCIIALYFFTISKKKIDQVISVVLSRPVNNDIERFCLAGIKARQNNEVKNLQHFFMRHNQIVFGYLLIYFEYEKLWHHHVPELDLKNTDSSKICVNYGPLFVIFNHLFGCPKANSGALHWQRASLVYLMLITVLYLIWSKGHKESWNEVRSQSPANHIFRVWIENLCIWSWSFNPLAIL